MAMLAEPRRKQKLSVDPRNRQWSDDQNKFGQKMLEKMGWTNGKGLGANEDGKTQHIKVSLKNNTLGVGCSQSYEDNWIAHQDDFNDILANLNQDHSTEEEGKKDDDDEEEDASRKSLEERSKKTKGRVHYKKFTRGKDISRYGATDINCILGVRSNKSASSTPQTQSVNNSDNEDTTSEDKTVEDSSHGFTTITQNTSMKDYFAKKMAELKKGKTSPPQQHVENGINDDDKESTEADSNGDDVKIKDKKKEKKKDKKKRTDNNNELHIQNSDEEIIDNSYQLNDSSKKKRKQEDILPSVEIIGNDKTTNDDSEEVVPRKKKCKNKRRKDDSDGEGQDYQQQIDSSNSSSKKSKKKKKKNKSIE